MKDDCQRPKLLRSSQDHQNVDLGDEEFGLDFGLLSTGRCCKKGPVASKAGRDKQQDAGK